MKLSEIENLCMFQTANDVDDLGEYLPYLKQYINDGYDRVVWAFDRVHLPTEKYPYLNSTGDVPRVPEWTHQAIADYATYCLYRNGNPNRQQRGMHFLSAFEKTLAKVYARGGVYRFTNIPE